MPTPFCKRKAFRLAVIAALIVAAGVATFFLNRQAGTTTNPASPPPGQGRIEIYTSPKGATITLDGKQRQEKTPATFSTPLGKHTVTLTLEGYDTATIKIDVIAANPAVIQQTFTKQGKITVDQKPEDFQTYTNEQYRYRIRYPDDWKVDADSPQVVNFLDKRLAAAPGDDDHGEEQTSLAILAQPNPGNLSPAEWYKARPEYSQEDQSQIKTRELTIGGRPAFQYETPYGFVPYLNTIVTGNGQVFIMQQIQNSPERETYDQVIQTFTLF